MRLAHIFQSLGGVLIIIAIATTMMADQQLQTPEPDLIFSHPLHVIEQEIECMTCHATIPTSAAAEDRNLPSMEVCADCHDVEDDTNCGQCHRDPDNPVAAAEIKLSVLFSHKQHMDADTGCPACHSMAGDTGELLREPSIPGKPMCMSCHDGLRAKRECSLCHPDGTNLGDIHPIGWRYQHAEQATRDPSWCQTCHIDETYCIECHRGDNQLGNIHELNYEFTHGLDAQGKEADCMRCHNRETFCNECHLNELRMPLAHSTLSWRNDHGSAARSDVENCTSCHQADDLTCARAGCHSDADGIRGTDPPIHSSDAGRFNSHGPWHNDDGYFCFACHTSTGSPGIGFCGYCHGGH